MPPQPPPKTKTTTPPPVPPKPSPTQSINTLIPPHNPSNPHPKPLPPIPIPISAHNRTHNNEPGDSSSKPRENRDTNAGDAEDAAVLGSWVCGVVFACGVGVAGCVGGRCYAGV
ncbi:predicted protein [Plenodomus lingam JN3]|uniref:Predicted protein n=1 Tax=Leptosphaeria maculans (strain JN3 / isolate v23.1.3 / race Av1-4-5-6-7-8) TaxID=985895 RepID=E5A0J4_LEPMJ|nr:predicted protein [Plenodomus lingam JN3]CBX97054.1 predicted protein [Plenodomus lingam JN3]